MRTPYARLMLPSASRIHPIQKATRPARTHSGMRYASGSRDKKVERPLAHEPSGLIGSPTGGVTASRGSGSALEIKRAIDQYHFDGCSNVEGRSRGRAHA